MSTSSRDAKPRIIDVALQSGVSTATVDRVLNNRPGVRQKTIDKVMDAVARLTDSTARPAVTPSVPAGLTLDILLAQGAGFANDVLSSELKKGCDQFGFTYRRTLTKRLNPQVLWNALEECLERGTDGIVVQPLDHPLVRDVVSRISQAGIPVVCVLTDLPSSERLAYVGLDNRAAGRTAGYLVGRLCHAPGTVALFAAGELYRSHEEREVGFRSVLRDGFPSLSLLPTSFGGDDPHSNFELARDLLSKNLDLRAICSIGGGNRGIEKALLDSGRKDEIVYCAFNLTPLTKQGLLSGAFDAIVHQDMQKISQDTLGVFVSYFLGEKLHPEPAPAEIIMIENLR